MRSSPREIYRRPPRFQLQRQLLGPRFAGPPPPVRPRTPSRVAVPANLGLYFGSMGDWALASGCKPLVPLLAAMLVFVRLWAPGGGIGAGLWLMQSCWGQFIRF